MRTLGLLMAMVVVMSLAVRSANAQISPEEAQQRMEQRRSQTTRPISEIEMLRNIILDLQRQIAALKAENQALAKQLAAIPPAPSPTSKPSSLAIGMTLKQVETFFGFPGNLVSQDAVSVTYEWITGGGFIPVNVTGGPVRQPSNVTTCMFRNGKLVSFTKN